MPEATQPPSGKAVSKATTALGPFPAYRFYLLLAQRQAVAFPGAWILRKAGSWGLSTGGEVLGSEGIDRASASAVFQHGESWSVRTQGAWVKEMEGEGLQ